MFEGIREQELKVLFDRLDTEIQKEKKDDYEIAISRGYAIYRPGEDKGYNDVARRADAAMYEDKAAYYKIQGERRTNLREPGREIPPGTERWLPACAGLRRDMARYGATWLRRITGH